MGQELRRRRRSRSRKGWLILPVTLLAVVLAGCVVLWSLDQQLPADGSSVSSQGDGELTTTTTQKSLPREFIDRNTSASYIILGNTDGKILYSKNADKKCYPASLTKLMTAIVATENADADTIFTVGNEVYMIHPQSSRAYLTVGSRLTLEQLLQAMLLPSGNDAAYVIAVQIGRLIANDPQLSQQKAVTVFCEKMTQRAVELGCTGTNFVTPDGIHDDKHYTTASDMLKIATKALQTEVIARTVGTTQVRTKLVSGQVVTWNNSNRLLKENNLYFYEYAIGMKTGTTDEAGYCLAAAATKDGRTSIAIVLNAGTESGRWEDARGLLELSYH